MIGFNYLHHVQNGMTPCHYAAMREHTHVIAFLMECGVGLDATDAQGRTPLHVACGALGREAVRALLEAGAQPLLKDKVRSARGTSISTAFLLTLPHRKNSSQKMWRMRWQSPSQGAEKL